MWDLIVSVPHRCLSFYITFYEKTLNQKSNPSTSTSSALPAHRIFFSFQLKISTPFRKLSKKKKKKKKKKRKKKKNFAFNNFFVLF